MPRGRQTTVVERPVGLRATRNNVGIPGEVVKPPRAKRVADENAGNESKSRKRAAFGDLTNVSYFHTIFLILAYLEISQ